MTVSDLLPCPFCGGTNVSVSEGSTFRWFYAGCNECGAQAGETRRDTMADDQLAAFERVKKDALTVWNTRDSQVGASDSQPPLATESHNERWAAYLSMEREAQAARRSTERTAIESAFEAEIEDIAPDQRAPFYCFWKRMKARVATPSIPPSREKE